VQTSTRPLLSRSPECRAPCIDSQVARGASSTDKNARPPNVCRITGSGGRLRAVRQRFILKQPQLDAQCVLVTRDS